MAVIDEDEEVFGEVGWVGGGWAAGAIRCEAIHPAGIIQSRPRSCGIDPIRIKNQGGYSTTLAKVDLTQLVL
jgi:hypothetical protein